MAMDKREPRSSSKKARVESPQVEVKQETEEGGGTAGGALVIVESARPREELTVKIYKDKLHCPVCTFPFKPPIFQCEAGHSACSSCHAQLDNKCYECGGAFRRNTTLEDVVGWHRVPCPNEAFGCRAHVTYHDAGDHQAECPCAPCRCSEPGCAFIGSPPMLRDHLAAAPHSWPVDKICYGVVKSFALPATLPRLLVAEEDGRVFLVSSRAMGPSYRGASVVGFRAMAAGRKYTCSMWATGHKSAATGRAEVVMVQTMEVPSCSETGEATAEEAVRLVVRNKNLHGAAMEMRLSVRIEKVPA